MAHFVIMGCGRVGATLAHTLEDAGHSVAIIDQDDRAFRRLRAGFTGRKVTGVGFDRETLKQAGVEDAYAFAAVSSGDNSNILATRVARETFHVPHVVARIYDPGPRGDLPAPGHPHGRRRALERRPGAPPDPARTAPRRRLPGPLGPAGPRRGGPEPRLDRPPGDRDREGRRHPGRLPDPVRRGHAARGRHLVPGRRHRPRHAGRGPQHRSRPHSCQSPPPRSPK